MTPTFNPMKRHHERCRDVRGRMSDYLDGDLDPRAAAAVERHTHWCPNCRRMLASLRRTLGGLRALGNEPLPDEQPRPPA